MLDRIIPSFFESPLIREIPPLLFTGDLTEIDAWTERNASAITAYLQANAQRKFAKLEGEDAALFDLRERTVSEMPLCVEARHLYKKMKGVRVIGSGAGEIGINYALSNGVRDAYEHVFGYAESTGIVIDFTFAQSVLHNEQLEPGERVAILDDHIGEFIYQPTRDLAVLRGPLEYINDSGAISYHLYGKRE